MTRRGRKKRVATTPLNERQNAFRRRKRFEKDADVGGRDWVTRRKCAEKHQLNHPQARSVAARMRVEYEDPSINHYRCPNCRYWHVGHDRRVPREETP